jgi:carboxyl-terminal processing protease
MLFSRLFRTTPLSRDFACALILLFYGLTAGKVYAGTTDTYKSLETFSNVLNVIENNYVEEVDTEKLIEGAIKGMLNSLDPHSSFMKPDDFKELQVETKGSFTGIGIEVTVVDGILTIVSPIEGSPAYDVGLKAGDKILKINDESTKDMTLMEAVKKLRGPKGSSVTISVFREGWTELQDFSIKRDVIPLHSVKVKMLDSRYGYARITNFQNKTTRDLDDALKDLTQTNSVKGLILDLRNNPGGLLDQAIRVSDLFIDEGVIVSTQGRLEDQNDVYYAHASGSVFSFPMVVLVNEGTASAAEIVAGALQDHRRALILGTQTFGKGSVQTIIPMANGAGLRLTTARYYTPNGISIQAKGITPDIIVVSEYPEEEPSPIQKKREFIREKDLKRHIPNGNDQNETEQEKDDEKENKDHDLQPTTDKIPQEILGDKQNDQLQQDRQLQTALILLKGLDVFEKFGE